MLTYVLGDFARKTEPTHLVGLAFGVLLALFRSLLLFVSVCVLALGLACLQSSRARGTKIKLQTATDSPRPRCRKALCVSEPRVLWAL